MESPSSRLQPTWLVVVIAMLSLMGLTLRSNSTANADPGSPGMALLILVSTVGLAAVAAAAWSSVRTRYEPAMRFVLLPAPNSAKVGRVNASDQKLTVRARDPGNYATTDGGMKLVLGCLGDDKPPALA